MTTNTMNLSRQKSDYMLQRSHEGKKREIDFKLTRNPKYGILHILNIHIRGLPWKGGKKESQV